MRLLSVIHGPVFGGGYNQLLQLREPLADRGCETIAVAPAERGNVLEHLCAAGADPVVLPLHRLRRSANPVTQARFVAGFWPEVHALRRVIRERGVDVVQAHGDTNPHAAIAGHLEGAAVVWQIYDTRTPAPLRRLTMPIVTRIADAVTTWGRELARVHSGVRSMGDRHIVVFPPVDERTFQPDPERRSAGRGELGVPGEALLVGAVGNINPSKGYEWLLRAVAAARQELPDLRLRVLGAHSPVHSAYERGLRDEARRLDLAEGDRLRFVDPGLRVPELMPALDVFAISSVPRSEGIPTVILEAMACALPVVATDVGAIREVVEQGVTGFLVPPEDPRALTGAILRLCTDAALRAKMGEEGRHRVLERYDLERCADAHYRAYQTALAHRRSRRRRPKPGLA